MTKPPMAHRIQKPFRYYPSEQTDVARTIKRVQDAMKEEAKAAEATNVRPLERKEKKAA